MIIGIDATRANKPQKTGVEWYSYHLIRELVKIPSPHTYRLYFNTPPEQDLSNLGPSVQYRILRWPFAYLWTQLRLSWEMLIHPPDLLFVPAQIIPVIHPARTATTIHDVAFKSYPESYSPRSRWYLDLAARWSQRLPLVLTVSQFSKREILKYYPMPAERIIVVPLGFSHGTLLPASVVAAKFNIQEPYLVSVGRLERKKNIIALIKGFDLIKRESWGNQFELILVGTKGHGWEEIERVIARSENKQDIKIVGWVTEAEKHTLIANATACVLLSAYEGFGLPLLEAMANKTPAITSNQAALPEVAGHAAYIVSRGDSDAVRDAVRDLLFNTELRERIITAGMQRVKEFTWQKTAQKTLSALEALLKSPPGTP